MNCERKGAASKKTRVTNEKKEKSRNGSVEATVSIEKEEGKIEKFFPREKVIITGNYIRPVREVQRNETLQNR